MYIDIFVDTQTKFGITLQHEQLLEIVKVLHIDMILILFCV